MRALKILNLALLSYILQCNVYFSLSLLAFEKSWLKIQIEHLYLIALRLSKSGSEEENQLLGLLRKFISKNKSLP